MSNHSRATRAVLFAACGLTALPLLYMMLWLAMIVGSFSRLWHPRIGEFDLGTAIRRSDAIELWGFAAMSLGWLAGTILLVLNRRVALVALISGCLIHVAAVWLWITDGQYYAGQFGMIVILLEMLAITLAHVVTRGRRLI